MRILIVKPSSLGDIIHTLVAFDYLRAALPEAEFDWLANTEYTDFVGGLDGVARVLPFPRGRFRRRRFPLWIPGFYSWLRTLRHEYDVAVDFQGLQRSGLMTRFSGARRRFGFRNARELAWLHYDKAVELPSSTAHASARYLHLARSVCEFFGAEVPEPETFQRAWRLALPTAVSAFSAPELDEGPRGNIIGLCPGSRWPSKNWTADHWARLAESLESAGCRPLFLGGGGERTLIEGIQACSDRPLRSICGRTTIWQSAALLARCHAVVSVDSAPLHLAASLGVPTVALFGPTDPARVAPRYGEHVVVRQESLSCLACYRRKCPLTKRLCLPEVDPQRVLGALTEVGLCLQGV